MVPSLCLGVEFVYRNFDAACPGRNYLELVWDRIASHVWSLIILRIFMGVFESVTYPSLFAIISKWCPEKERSKMVSFRSAVP